MNTHLLPALRLLLVATFLLPAVPAAAIEAGPYLSGQLGYSKPVGGCAALPAAAACKEGAALLRFDLGYRFDRFFAAEVGYADLGNLLQSGGNKVKATAVEAVGKIYIPFGERLSMHYLLGATRIDLKRSGGVAAGSAYLRGKAGAGIDWAMGRDVALLAEVATCSRVGDAATGRFRPLTLSAGAAIGF